MPTLDYSTATDHDNAQAEAGVHHEQPTGSDYAAADVIEQGPPSTMLAGKSPVAAWFGHEDSGTTINDVTGNGHDMDVTGATPNATGPLGFSAWSFDGTDDVAKSTPNQTYTITDDHTFGAMLNTTDTTEWTGILTQDTDSGDYSQLVMNFSDGIRVQIGETSSDTYRYNGSVTINDGSWHLVGFSYDASLSDPLSLYHDGIEDTNVNKVEQGTPSFSSVSTGFQLGLTRDDFRYLDGDICFAFVDDVAWSATDWSDLWETFTGTATHTSSAKVS